MSKVEVSRDEPFEKALKRFKSKIKKEGILEEVRRREFYEKPSQRRRRMMAAAIRRQRRRNLMEE